MDTGETVPDSGVDRSWPVRDGRQTVTGRPGCPPAKKLLWPAKLRSHSNHTRRAQSAPEGGVRWSTPEHQGEGDRLTATAVRIRVLPAPRPCPSRTASVSFVSKRTPLIHSTRSSARSASARRSVAARHSAAVLLPAVRKGVEDRSAGILDADAGLACQRQPFGAWADRHRRTATAKDSVQEVHSRTARPPAAPYTASITWETGKSRHGSLLADDRLADDDQPLRRVDSETLPHSPISVSAIRSGENADNNRRQWSTDGTAYGEEKLRSPLDVMYDGALTLFIAELT
ncbi:hypothetical protein THAOC_30135 [Thalassiosira oceanica]|uniref:Uncharacterized protein n=1 Tax=Thalassiosira oceanica TaxID=159749 RepID=K0REU4_THAOC|nr:hypothetical protein THAOC_30135 [Thalassiosira oceanica]|eukprot:EJK50769.1 hypothetical protein THAOC_30135 [Thalassiosira oceanica]